MVLISKLGLDQFDDDDVQRGGLLAAMLLVVPALATAGGRESRVQTLPYVAGGLNQSPEPGGTTGIMVQEVVGGVVFDAGSEPYVSVDIQDRSGMPVAAHVVAGSTATPICGATKRPIKVLPGSEIKVFLMNGNCGGGQSVVTTGDLLVGLAAFWTVRNAEAS